MLFLEKSWSVLTLRAFVDWPFRFYSFVGIKLFEWDENDKMTKREKIVMLVTFLNLNLNFFCKLCYFIFDEFKDTVHMTQWFLYLSFAVNGFFKMFTVAMGRKTLAKVLKDLERLFPQTAKEKRDFKLIEGYRFLMRHSKIMIHSHWSIAMMFIVFPIVQSLVDYIKTGVLLPRTPYVLTYPFDSSYGWGYAFAYATQFLGGITISCYFVASDLLLICTIYVVILQFQYLCYRINSFKSKSFEEDLWLLKDILEKHHLLNDYAKRVNQVFSLSILLNYMISIMVIVLIGIQIVTGSNLLDFVKFVGFFASATIQVYYVCVFGTLLMEQSALVGESFIAQEWYFADVRYQRMLVMAIARSQRPAHLTAFKFFMISMESFSNLMTTSYQFFTLLKTRMEEEGL